MLSNSINEIYLLAIKKKQLSQCDGALKRTEVRISRISLVFQSRH